MTKIETSSLERIAKGTGIIFIGVIISKLLTYFFRIGIFRFLGAEDYGLFSLGLAILGIFGIVALLGLAYGVTRYIAFYKARKDKKRVKGAITSSLKIVFPFSILLSIVLFFASPYLAINFFGKPELVEIFRVLSLSIPFTAMVTMFSSIYRGFERVRYIVYSENIFANVVKLAGVVIIGLLGFGIYEVALSWTIAMVLTFLFSAYFLEKKVYPILKNPVKSAVMRGEIIHFSLPLFLAGFMAMIVVWTDTIMLGYFMASEHVGVYNAALPTSQILKIVSTMFGVLFLPVITSLYSKNKFGQIKDVLKTVTKWIFYINLSLFLLLIFFSQEILNVLFGPEAVAGYMALCVLSTGYFVFSSLHISGNILLTLKKTNIVLMNTIIVVVWNISMNIYLIPIYGILGAALATSSAFIIYATLFAFETWYFIHSTPFSINFARAFLAGIVSIILIYYLGHAIFAEFTIYAIIPLFILFLILYIFLILVLRGISEEDLKVLYTIERKTGLRIEFLRKILRKFIR